MSTVVFRTNDEQIFKVDAQVAQLMVTIKHAMEDVVDDSDNIIPLPNVESRIFTKIVDYGNKWVSLNDTEKTQIKQSTTIITDWEKEFFNMDHTSIFEIIIATNYLQMEVLLNAACKRVAVMITNKTTEEIRTMFNITNDFTPEEESAIRDEHSWATDD